MHHSVIVRSATIAAITSVITGLSIAVYGTLNDDLPRTVAGSSLLTIALLLSALLSIRSWIIDAQSERHALARAIRDADDERTRYVAAQAALEMERQRVLRDAAMEREQSLARVKAAQAAMREKFEEERARLICEALETAVKLVEGGLLEDRSEAVGHAKVIAMPSATRQREAQPEGVRDRDARP
ncbi:hypothetical protein [Streptomyces sp. NPDC059928]|uniref:hypothetical protein n=1 Tax=unclassified Streptomyces TaxID=2593676 RepID=UPI00364CD99A